MIHENYNVCDLAASLAFYEKALGLHEKRRKEAADGSYIIVYVGNDASDFELELTWLRDHPQAYDIGEEEFHLAFRVDDFAAAHALHSEMGCICFENDAMGIYFIQDPDGYWLEIVPTRSNLPANTEKTYDLFRNGEAVSSESGAIRCGKHQQIPKRRGMPTVSAVGGLHASGC